MKYDCWVLYLMDPYTAEPIPFFTQPFTRLDYRVLESRASWIPGNPPFRIDPGRLADFAEVE